MESDKKSYQNFENYNNYNNNTVNTHNNNNNNNNYESILRGFDSDNDIYNGIVSRLRYIQSLASSNKQEMTNISQRLDRMIYKCLSLIHI